MDAWGDRLREGIEASRPAPERERRVLIVNVIWRLTTILVLVAGGIFGLTSHHLDVTMVCAVLAVVYATLIVVRLRGISSW